jgi:hypothetical protein
MMPLEVDGPVHPHHVTEILQGLDLQRPYRHVAWRERIGDVRVILADAGAPLPPLSAGCGEPIERALAALQLFRGPFSDGQALGTIRAAGLADPADALATLVRLAAVVPSLTRGLWVCARSTARALSDSVQADVHRQIGFSYAGPLTGRPATAYVSLEAANGIHVVEAIHHLSRACEKSVSAGRYNDHDDSAGSLAILLVVYVATPEVYSLAAKFCRKTATPFVNLYQQHWENGWKPAGRLQSALANLLAFRHQELASRRTRRVGLDPDDERLRAITAKFIRHIVGPENELVHAAGAASVLLHNKAPLDPGDRRGLEEVLDRALHHSDGAVLVYVHPELLAARAALLTDKKQRHRQYLRCLLNGHGANAGLLLATLGTAPFSEVEAIWHVHGQGLSLAGHRWINSLEWRGARGRLGEDYRAGYAFLQDLGLVD